MKKMRLQEKLDIIVNDLKGYDPEKIILFGSASKGETDRYSDIDIVVIKNTNKTFLKRLKDLATLCSLDEPVDILAYTPDEVQRMLDQDSDFMKKILKEGKVIYEKQSPKRPKVA